MKRGAMPIVVEEKMPNGIVSMDVYRRNHGRIYNVKLGGMCINNCHYCYLYSANKFHPEVSIYVDVDAMKREMRKAVKNSSGSPVTFNAGEHTDSLSLDPITQITTDLVPFVPSLHKTTLELRTKSAEVDNLECLNHKGRTVIAWSLAPTQAIKLSEGGDITSFRKRLNAMNKVIDWGYPVALKIDPVIPVDGWKRSYKQMIDRISKVIDPKDVHHYAVGVLRMNGMLKKMIPVLFPNSVINGFDMTETRKGKYTHQRVQRREIYNYILKLMKDRYPETPFYLSMEDTDFADNVIGGV